MGGLGRIRCLPCITGQCQHAQLVSRLAVPGLARQAQQANALLPRTEALAAVQQQVAIEALGRDIPEVGLPGVLPLHPVPGTRVAHQRREAQQPAGHRITQPGPQLPDGHQGSSG